MADWVSNLAPLGQNRVSRPPEQACLCVNAGLFILFNWLFLVYQKERKYSRNNVTAWGRTWHLWLKTEQTNHQNKHAMHIRSKPLWNYLVHLTFILGLPKKRK